MCTNTDLLKWLISGATILSESCKPRLSLNAFHCLLAAHRKIRFKVNRTNLFTFSWLSLISVAMLFIEASVKSKALNSDTRTVSGRGVYACSACTWDEGPQSISDKRRWTLLAGSRLLAQTLRREASLGREAGGNGAKNKRLSEILLKL